MERVDFAAVLRGKGRALPHGVRMEAIDPEDRIFEAVADPSEPSPGGIWATRRIPSAPSKASWNFAQARTSATPIPVWSIKMESLRSSNPDLDAFRSGCGSPSGYPCDDRALVESTFDIGLFVGEAHFFRRMPRNSSPIPEVGFQAVSCRQMT